MSKQKAFFERLGEILNSPLPGTESDEVMSQPKLGDEDISVLERVKNILNTPLPGAVTPQSTSISESDFGENWWDQDWAVFKQKQEADRTALNTKQRMDQEGFAQYQEGERTHFESYQLQAFEAFQLQQQAKLNWIQEKQLAQAAGVPAGPYSVMPSPQRRTI